MRYARSGTFTTPASTSRHICARNAAPVKPRAPNRASCSTLHDDVEADRGLRGVACNVSVPGMAAACWRSRSSSTAGSPVASWQEGARDPGPTATHTSGARHVCAVGVGSHLAAATPQHGSFQADPSSSRSISLLRAVRVRSPHRGRSVVPSAMWRVRVREGPPESHTGSMRRNRTSTPATRRLPWRTG